LAIEVDWRRCQSPEMVRKEISIHRLACNPVRRAMVTAAKLSDVRPRTPGFTGTKRVSSVFVDAA